MSRFQEQPLYNSSAPPPKYNPGTSQPYAPSGPPAPYGGEGGFGSGLDKSPYDGDRFKPKKRFNDPIFLILFIAQVSGPYIIVLDAFVKFLLSRQINPTFKACGILCCLWDRALFMDFKRWPRRWNWWQFRRVKHRDFSYLGPVSFVVHMALAGLIAFNVLFRHTAYLLLLVTGAALTISALQLILTRTFTRMIMHITLILSICLNMCVLLWI